STFEMAFVLEQPGGDAESLFIDSRETSPLSDSRLGRIDAALHVGVVGTHDVAGRAKIAGDAAGRLFAMFVGASGGSPLLSQIDPLTAKTQATSWLMSVNPGGESALGAWGGYLWIFTAPAVSDGSRLERYTPLSGEIDTVAQNLGFTVRSASAPTCGALQ